MATQMIIAIAVIVSRMHIGILTLQPRWHSTIVGSLFHDDGSCFLQCRVSDNSHSDISGRSTALEVSDLKLSSIKMWCLL